MAWWSGQPVYGSNPVSKFVRENFAHLKTYVDYIINSGVNQADFTKLHAITVSAATINTPPIYLQPTGTADDGPTIQAALAAGNVELSGEEFSITTPIVWPTRYGWSIKGSRGLTIFRAMANINIMTPPPLDQGQYGTIQGIIFSSNVAGQGTGIGGIIVPNAAASYIAHLLITECDFRNSLRYGISGILIENDIIYNRFGFNDIGKVLFKAILSIGDNTGRATNANRIKCNEIVLCTDDYAVDLQGGYLIDYEGNTHEGNQTTSGVIRTKDTEVGLWTKNWFEGNGAVPTYVIEQGTVLNSLINVFDGGIINVIGQGTTSIIDITTLVNKRITLKNLVIAGQTHVLQNGAAFDNPDWVVESSNNFITGAFCPLAPTSSTMDWGFGGSGVIQNNLTIEGDLTVNGGLLATRYVTYSGDTVALIAAATTIYTFPIDATQPRVFLVTLAPYTATITEHAGYAIVATFNANIAIVGSVLGAHTVLSLLGMALQVTQDDVGGGGLRYLVNVTRVG
jgi:hypothetical protein